MMTHRQGLTIGIVNNMPEAAFEATARQFHALLGQAAFDKFELRLRFFSPPQRPSDDEAANPFPVRHETADALWGAELDALIVTGAEPRATNIADEPSLPFLARLVDWAEDGCVPAIWSCLAAHAAVYRLDGIERRQRDAKLFGVFACDKVADHKLLGGIPEPWVVPHSRLNELPEAELVAHGYRILTRSNDVGIDCFVKEAGTQHLFLNGHPEYELTTLRSEYRRDVRRYLLRERGGYPTAPTGYFSDETILALAAFHKRASAKRMSEIMAEFPAAPLTAAAWRDTALGLFRNWLVGIADCKAEHALPIAPALHLSRTPIEPVQLEPRAI